MSEISVISNQYNTVVDTTDSVNNSIIALKKRAVLAQKKGNQKFELSNEELAFSKKFLSDFLGSLKQLREKGVMESEFLPNIVIKDFQKKVINAIPFFETEVQAIIDSIMGDKELEDAQFNLLDKMAATLDNERTVLFKKLRTARG